MKSHHLDDIGECKGCGDWHDTCDLEHGYCFDCLAEIDDCDREDAEAAKDEDG